MTLRSGGQMCTPVPLRDDMQDVTCKRKSTKSPLFFLCMVIGVHTHCNTEIAITSKENVVTLYWQTLISENVQYIYIKKSAWGKIYTQNKNVEKYNWGHPSIHHPSIHPSTHPSTHPSIHPCMRWEAREHLYGKWAPPGMWKQKSPSPKKGNF